MSGFIPIFRALPPLLCQAGSKEIEQIVVVIVQGQARGSGTRQRDGSGIRLLQAELDLLKKVAPIARKLGASPSNVSVALDYYLCGHALFQL
jgi:hypothetical protein